MKIIFFIMLVFFFACTDLLINDLEYHSIELSGNGWVQIDKGSNFNINAFTIQSWFSGADTTINSTQTILSMINSSGEILLGIFKDPIYSDKLDIWIDNENISTVQIPTKLDDIDSFNLISVRGDTSAVNQDLISINIFINTTKILSHDVNLTLEKIEGLDFVFGGKVSTGHNYRDSFWHGCIDEIRLWNTAIVDSVIEYHNAYAYKLSEESDNQSYDGYIGKLSGLWRFYTTEETYLTVPNEACSTIERIYNDNPCSTDSKAMIYTLENNKIEFSEKHK